MLSAPSFDRRGFLQTGAAATAAGAAASRTASAADDNPELRWWSARVGSTFTAYGVTLVLRSVEAGDPASDATRPAGVRRQSLSLVFEAQAPASPPDSLTLPANAHGLLLTRVHPPEGVSACQYEAVLG